MDKRAAWIGAALFAAGLLLLLSAPGLGIWAADRALWAEGGSIAADRYDFIMESTALSCQIGGGICALAGVLLGVLRGRGGRS